MIVFENKYAVINYFEDIFLLELDWKEAFAPTKEYHQVLSIVENSFKTKKVEKYLANMKNQVLVNPDEQRNVINKIVPFAIEKGVQKAAFVLSNSEPSEVYAKRIIEKIQSMNREGNYFETKEQALAWLKS